MNTEKMFINGIDIAEYGARALRDIKIGGTEVENDYFQGRNRTNYTLMSTTFGLKPVSFTLAYFSESLNTALTNKSRLELAMFNGCEIYLPDGFYYRAMLQKIGQAEIKGIDGVQVKVLVSYEFKAIQHGDLVTIEDGTAFIAAGTTPKMDACLSVTVGASASHYYLDGADFGAVSAGDVLVFDGINKRFLKNGAPTTASAWVRFPSVVPGNNAFTALDTVKVEFYPCYM